jgi:uncharacterized membrane protein YhiD involved in acid resistance
MAEWLVLAKYMCAEYQAHVFMVLALTAVLMFALVWMVKNAFHEMSKSYNKLDSRQTLAEELNKLKFEFVGKGLQDVKDAVNNGKKDTDKKIDAIDKKVDDTVIHLQNKWRRYTNAEERVQQTEVYAEAKTQAEAEN